MAELRDQLQATLGDNYVLEHELGGGGMSRVFVAHETALGRQVVVKVLPPEMAAEVSIDRFRREIQLAAHLQHPHIVPLLTAGETNGLPFYTMPYVRGESLRSRIAKEHELSVTESIRILREIALALGYAHENGVVHRDIKPENILISGGSVVVADFGVSKALTASSGSRVTTSGIALGTPAYMAPEQATADPDTDYRADIYAMGVVAYEMLTGSTPFAGRSAQATLAAHVTETPDSITNRRATVPPLLASLIMSCLAKRPSDRPHSAQDVLHEIDALTTPSGGLQPTMRLPSSAHRSMKRPIVFIGAAIAAIMIIGFGAARLMRNGAISDPAVNTPVIAVIPFRNVGKPDGQEFADGMTEAITGRLSTLSGLKVIGSQSAAMYADTKKTVKQIADELGVNYLLTGTVRWDRGSDGREIVRVSPALVRTSDATQVWAQPFETVLSRIFEVQSNVAGEVASALNVALLEPEKNALGARPTDNVEAYGFYLRGLDLIRSGVGPSFYRQAIEALEKAIALDPKFALAYAQLSIAHSELHWATIDKTKETHSRAQAAADKALSLDPSLPEGHLALAFIHYHVEFEFDDALRELSIVERARPNDFDALAIKAAILRRQGKWRESIATMNRAIEIEPRIAKNILDQSQTHMVLREYDQAERLVDRALAVVPDRGETWRRAMTQKANIAIDRDGDLAKAIRISRQKFAAQPNRDSAALDVLLNLWPGTADPELRRAALDLRWKPGMREEPDVIARKMGIYRAFGNNALARIYAESTLVAGKKLRFSRTNAASGYAVFARAYAILGNRPLALQALRKAIELRPLSFDAFSGTMILQNRADALMILGDHDAAIDQLEDLLNRPSFLSRNRLRLSPLFDPIRSNPRFQRLVAEP